MSGRTNRARRFMSPGAPTPISITAKRCQGRMASRVRGTPWMSFSLFLQAPPNEGDERCLLPANSIADAPGNAA